MTMDWSPHSPIMKRAKEAFVPPLWLSPPHPVEEDAMAVDDTTPEWREVPGFPGYEVSDQGQVRSFRRYVVPRLLKPGETIWGHLLVVLQRDGGHTRHIHRLVLESFVGLRPPGMETRHLDGNPKNNRLTNLRWGTRSENSLDRVRHGVDWQSRKTHCPQGHPYDEVNTFASKGRRERRCRACYRIREQARAAAREAARQVGKSTLASSAEGSE